MKKWKYLLLLPFLALTSCGEKNIYGTYGFSLGNQGGTHFGVYATLKNEKYVDPEDPTKDQGIKKTFNFKVDMSEKTKSVKPSEYTIKDSLAEDLGALSSGEIRGYYYEGTNESLGLRIHVGASEIDKIFQEIGLITVTSDAIIECIVAAYINAEGQLNIRIPVSLNDLIFQLLWYGYYIKVDDKGVELKDLLVVEVTPAWPVIGTHFENRAQLIGTIPDSESVQFVNNLIQGRPDIFTDTSLVFRAHHVINLALSKQ